MTAKTLSHVTGSDGLTVDQQLLVAEEGHARPIDELRQMLLRIDQRIIVSNEIVQKSLTPLEPAGLIFIRQSLGEKRVVFGPCVILDETVLGLGADIIEEIVRIFLPAEFEQTRTAPP